MRIGYLECFSGISGDMLLGALVDAAREEWWVGLRSAEKEHYRALGGNFENAELDYRRGFEAALP